MFKTEAEAWEAIADTLEMIEGMPEWDHGPARGLCEVITMLRFALVESELLGMRARIKDSLGDREWLAKPGAWKPRVTIARKFAEQARNNS